MTLRVLSVAYPFAPVTADPLGGAEQVLALLDRGVLAAGGRSRVIAVEGSSPAGELAPIPVTPGPIGPEQRALTHAQVRQALEREIAEFRPDVVHLHGVDFHAYLPAPGPPALVTLHLPLAWHPPEALRPTRPNTWLAPVSADQVRRYDGTARLLAPIENGVDLEAFGPARKRGFVLALGRICPEKGFHLALDAAREAGLPMLLAGDVFPYPEHERYLREEVAPRLDRARRWIGPVAGRRKRRLLAAAGCLVVPSLVPETSSLVAREALASGTPVVGLRNGALVDAVLEGRTGLLVDGSEALSAALVRAMSLDPLACRAEAEARFDARRTVGRYLELYRALAHGRALPLVA